jgi:hypothetical protein
VVTKCDECGNPGDDVRTYTIRLDGQAWEIDLDQEHLGTVTIAHAMEIGRALDPGIRRPGGNHDLERRIRNKPAGG